MTDNIFQIGRIGQFVETNNSISHHIFGTIATVFVNKQFSEPWPSGPPAGLLQ